VNLLLNNGAQINQSRKDGIIPLYFPCVNGHTEIVKTLLVNKADISLLFKGKYPLQMEQIKNQEIKQLLEQEVIQ